MPSSPSTLKVVEIVSISTSLLAAGGIATLSLFDVPILQSQPASHSLPSIRWLFSRGSHIFPQAAAISSAGFIYLSYNALPLLNRTVTRLAAISLNNKITNGYLAAAILCLSIAPVTTYLMIPTNFELIKLNEDRGGAHSEASAQLRKTGEKSRTRNAEESVAGEGQASELTDLSGPQGKTSQNTTEDDGRKVRELLSSFSKLNALRALLMATGGTVGLWTALS